MTASGSRWETALSFSGAVGSAAMSRVTPGDDGKWVERRTEMLRQVTGGLKRKSLLGELVKGEDEKRVASADTERELAFLSREDRYALISEQLSWGVVLLWISGLYWVQPRAPRLVKALALLWSTACLLHLLVAVPEDVALYSSPSGMRKGLTLRNLVFLVLVFLFRVLSLSTFFQVHYELHWSSLPLLIARTHATGEASTVCLEQLNKSRKSLKRFIKISTTGAVAMSFLHALTGFGLELSFYNLRYNIVMKFPMWCTMSAGAILYKVRLWNLHRHIDKIALFITKGASSESNMKQGSQDVLRAGPTLDEFRLAGSLVRSACVDWQAFIAVAIFVLICNTILFGYVNVFTTLLVEEPELKFSCLSINFCTAFGVVFLTATGASINSRFKKLVYLTNNAKFATPTDHIQISQYLSLEMLGPSMCIQIYGIRFTSALTFKSFYILCYMFFFMAMRLSIQLQ